MAPDGRADRRDDTRRRPLFGADGLVHGTDLAVTGILLAVCAWLYYLTTTFEEVSPLFAQDVPPEMLPRLLIWTIAILSLLLPFEHLLKPGGREHFDEARSVAIHRMAYFTAGLLALVVLSIEWIGTYFAIIAVCFLLPVLWGERRWKLLVPYAIVFPTAVMFLFSRLLGVYFDPGAFGIDLR